MVFFLPFGCGQHTGFFSPHLLEYITQGDCAMKNSQKVNYKLVWSSYVSIVLRDCRLHWSVYAHTCTLTLFIYLLLAINQSYKMIWWTKNASSLAKVFWSLALLKKTLDISYYPKSDFFPWILIRVYWNRSTNPKMQSIPDLINQYFFLFIHECL